jgi:hypothetical protein
MIKKNILNTSFAKWQANKSGLTGETINANLINSKE